MPIQQTLNKGKVPVHIWTGDTESHALDQLANVSQMPFVHHHVAAMPDVHAGIGATVGSVIPTRGAIIPAAVGVDIGCGMNAIRTSLKAEDLPESLRQLRNGIEKAIDRRGRARRTQRGTHLRTVDTRGTAHTNLRQRLQLHARPSPQRGIHTGNVLQQHGEWHECEVYVEWRQAHRFDQ